MALSRAGSVSSLLLQLRRLHMPNHRARLRSKPTAEHRRAADAFQPPLRCGFQARLSRSVDMTSDVKSREQLFYVCLMIFPLFRLSEEPEPVNTTVDHADIRGLVTTLL